VALNVTRRLKNMGSWVWQLQRTDVRRKVGAQGVHVQAHCAPWRDVLQCSLSP